MSVPSSNETRQHKRSFVVVVVVVVDTHGTPPPVVVVAAALPRPLRVHLALMNRINRDIT